MKTNSSASGFVLHMNTTTLKVKSWEENVGFYALIPWCFSSWIMLTFSRMVLSTFMVKKERKPQYIKEGLTTVDSFHYCLQKQSARTLLAEVLGWSCWVASGKCKLHPLYCKIWLASHLNISRLLFSAQIFISFCIYTKIQFFLGKL